jgi:hypothetical protein
MFLRHEAAVYDPEDDLASLGTSLGLFTIGLLGLGWTIVIAAGCGLLGYRLSRN